MKKLLLTAVLFSVTLGFSQTKKAWSLNVENRDNMAKTKGTTRQSFPKEFKLFNLNINELRNDLFSVVGNQSKHSTIISLPNADGTLEQFQVFENSNFEADLQAQFPQIRAFSGKGITDKYATLKLSISPE